MANELQRFEEKLRITPGCWLWTGSTTRKGYGQFRYNGKPAQAHRVSYMLYKGEPGNLCVLHKCDNPKCVNPAHLVLGTQQENLLDMMEKGRHKTISGIEAGTARFTADEVRRYRHLYQSGISASELSRIAKVPKQTMYAMVSGKTYKGV